MTKLEIVAPPLLLNVRFLFILIFRRLEVVHIRFYFKKGAKGKSKDANGTLRRNTMLTRLSHSH